MNGKFKLSEHQFQKISNEFSPNILRNILTQPRSFLKESCIWPQLKLVTDREEYSYRD